MKLFSKDFFDYNVKADTFTIIWNENSKKITEKKFFSEVERLASLIRKHQPSKILGSVINLNHILVGEDVAKYLKTMVPAFKNANIEKLGVVVGENLFKQLFVDQLFEKAMKIHKFEGRFFKTRTKAEKWLK